MSALIKETDVKLDSRHRVTVKKPASQYYKMKQYDDGRIVMEPQKLISKEVFEQMDRSIKAIELGEKGNPIDLNEAKALLNL